MGSGPRRSRSCRALGVTADSSGPRFTVACGPANMAYTSAGSIARSRHSRRHGSASSGNPGSASFTQYCTVTQSLISLSSMTKLHPKDLHWSKEATTVGEDAVCSKASGALLALPQPVRASDALLRAYWWGTGVDGRAHLCARGLADTSSWCKVAGGIGTGGHCSSSIGTSAAAQLRHSAGAGRQCCDLRLPAQHITNTTKLSTTLTAPASVRFPLLGLST